MGWEGQEEGRREKDGGGGGSDSVLHEGVSPSRCTGASNHGGHVPMHMTPSALCLCTGPKKHQPQRPRRQAAKSSLREALHVRHVDGISQACIVAQADEGTLSPAIHHHIEQYVPVGVQLARDPRISTRSRHQLRSNA